MRRSQPQQEEYVPWEEGAKIIGINKSSFFYHVDKGDIAEQEGTAPRQGRYLVSDILKVKAKRDGRRPRKKYTRKNEHLIDWIGVKDLPAGITLAATLYEEDLLDASDDTALEKFIGWRKNNDKISMAAFTSNREKCLASIQVLPLPEFVILDILSGKRSETNIQADEIQSYEAPGPYILLVNSALALHEHRQLLTDVLLKYVNFWVSMFPERYIRKVYAQAMSPQGMLLVQHFFMTPRYDLADNAFELDFSKPVLSKILRKKFIKKLVETNMPFPLDLYHYKLSDL